MHWTLDFETYKGIALVRATGPIVVDAFLSYMKTGLADPRWRKGMPVLLDFRDIDSGQLSAEDIESMAAAFESHAQVVGTVKAAVVVSMPGEYGLIKIWEELTRHMFTGHDVFYTMNDALAFLGQALDSETKDASDSSVKRKREARRLEDSGRYA